MAGQQNFEFFTRPTHNNIKQRAEADIAIKDIENVADFIKRELEQPTLGSDKPIVTEKSATVEQNGAKIENGASEKDATVNTLKKPGVWHNKDINTQLILFLFFFPYRTRLNLLQN